MSLDITNKTYRDVVVDDILFNGESFNKTFVDSQALQDSVTLLTTQLQALCAYINNNTNLITLNNVGIGNNSIEATNQNTIINTNSTNIGINTTDIGVNTNNIATNATNIGINTTNTNDNSGLIITNSNNIATNTTDIGTNTTDIGTNTTDIGTNTTNLGNNEIDIGSNMLGISTNEISISNNTTNIGTNTSNIITNTTDIGNNTTDIANNANVITTNFGLISNNTINISTNTTDVGNNTTNIGTNTTDVGNNTTDITTNSGLITTNTTNIGTNSTDITTLQNSLSGNLITQVFISSVDVGDFSQSTIKSWNDGLTTPNTNVFLYATETTLSTDFIKHVFHVDDGGNLIRIYGQEEIISIYKEAILGTTFTVYPPDSADFNFNLDIPLLEAGKYFLIVVASASVNSTALNDSSGSINLLDETLIQIPTTAVSFNGGGPGYIINNMNDHYIYDTLSSATLGIKLSVSNPDFIFEVYKNTKCIIAPAQGNSMSYPAKSVSDMLTNLGLYEDIVNMTVSLSAGVYLLIADVYTGHYNLNMGEINIIWSDEFDTLLTDSLSLYGAYKLIGVTSKRLSSRIIVAPNSSIDYKIKARPIIITPVHVFLLSQVHQIEITSGVYETVILSSNQGFTSTLVFQDTTLSFILPSIGTYMLMSDILCNVTTANANNDKVYARFYDVTNNLPVAYSEQYIVGSAPDTSGLQSTGSLTSLYEIKIPNVEIRLQIRFEGVGSGIQILTPTRMLNYKI